MVKRYACAAFSAQMLRVIRSVSASDQSPSLTPSSRKADRARRKCSAVEQLGQPERVGRVKKLAERDELKRLREHRLRPASHVVRGQAEVRVHVREHLRQITGVTVERVVVQQHDPRAGWLERPDQRSEQQRVCLMEVKVAVAVTRVELHRQPEFSRRPDEEPVQGFIRESAVGFGQPTSSGGRDVAAAGPFRRQVEAHPVRRDRLGRDDTGFAGGGQRLAVGVREAGGGCIFRRNIHSERLQPDHLTCRRPRELTEFGRREQPVPVEPRVDEQRAQPRSPEEPARHLGGAEFGSPRDIRRGRDAGRQVEHRRTPAKERQARERVGEFRHLALIQQSRQVIGGHVVTQHSVTVVVGQWLSSDPGQHAAQCA
jgi:hypothetical protein